MKNHGLRLSTIAWAAALLPFITIHVSYLMAAAFGHVDWCIPYLESCTSISATGRQLPEKIWFKAMMIPAALTAALMWWSAAAWSRTCGSGRYPRTLVAMPLLGLLAAVFLIMYTAALGESGDTYRLMRSTGVKLSFAFTYLSQLMLTRLLGDVAQHQNDHLLSRWYPRLLGLNILLLIVGILSVILDETVPVFYNRYVDDAFEWWMALLINLYFACVALAWHPEPGRIGIVRSDPNDPDDDSKRQ